MPGLTFPPFPDDVPTHPLLVVDYELLLKKNPQEIETLWKAATELGFWYLKNHGVDDVVDGMFKMGEETMELPLEEKLKFEQGDGGLSFGYKVRGGHAVDSSGNLDTVEFINVAKDDAFAWPGKAHRTYPDTVNARMESTVVPFIKKSDDVTNTIINIFNDKLGFPDGTLASRHSTEYSGSESRVIKNAAGNPVDRVGIGAHTDFGSLSFLHNRLGGLQVLPPNVTEWQYVRPIPGHAICNVGDALALFSGGILRSNLHRVLYGIRTVHVAVSSPFDRPAPGAQSKLDRWSVVYFSRPGDSVKLRALTELSPIVARAVDETPEKDFDAGATSLEWFTRRVKNQRIKNRTGPETWIASRGTEYVENTVY